MSLRPKRLLAYCVLAPLALCVLPFLLAFCLLYLVFELVHWALEETLG
jgi:hypothetical protein